MSTTKGFSAYKKYLAIMMHFNAKTDYDYFKYNGKTNVTLESYNKNKKNIYTYGGIEKRVGGENLETFFFVNMEDGSYKKMIPQIWYKNYKKVVDKLDTFDVDFKNDLRVIVEESEKEGCTYNDLFNGGKFHLHPLLYVWYDKGMISRFTMLFIDSYIESFIDESSSSDPLLWKEVVDRHLARVGFYRRCYFHRLYTKDELIKFGQTQLKTIQKR